MPTVADRRPRLPLVPLAPVAIASAAGIVVDRYAEPWPTWAWAAIAAVAAIVAWLGFRRPGLSVPALIVAFVALGGGWHHRRWSDLPADDLARLDWREGRLAWVRGVLAEVPEFRPGEATRDRGSTRAAIDVMALRDGPRWRAASGRVSLVVSGDCSDLRAGEPVQAVGRLAEIAGPLNPGEADRRPLSRALGFRLRMGVDDPASLWPDPEGEPWWWSRWMGSARSASHQLLVARLDPTVAPLAAALLLGRREAVDPGVNDAFARTGTTHLLAISGLHLQAMGGFVLIVLQVIGLGWKRSAVGVMLATLAYTLLVGAMPSVVRSAAMTCVACLAVLCDRPGRPSSLLTAAVMATLAWNPSYLFDIGCQLSFLSVAALFWAVPPVARRLGLRAPDGSILVFDPSPPEPDGDPLDRVERFYAPRWKRWLGTAREWLALGLVTSAVVWLVDLPLVALRFHVVSPVGVLLNLPLIPLTTAALLLAGLTLGLSMVAGPLASPFAWACAGSLKLTEAIVRWGASLRAGHAFVAGPAWGWVLAFYVMLALAGLASAARCRYRACAWGAFGLVTSLGLLSAILPRTPGATEVDVLAIGHGLSVVIQGADGRTLLYDCGRLGDPRVGRRVVAPALWARGVSRIETVILSHADADHYNGLPDLLDRFAIGEVRVPPGFADPGASRLLDAVRARGVPVRPIVAGDRIDLGDGASVSILHPREGWEPSAPDNARSVALAVGRGRDRLVLTGDLDGIGLAELTARPVGPIAAMLAPHHGGRTANPPYLYDWARPDRVLVSQRRPPPSSRDPLAILAVRNVPVLRTWQVGAIRLRWEGSGLSVRGFAGEARPGQGDLFGPGEGAHNGPDVPAPGRIAMPPWLLVTLTVSGLALGSALCLGLAVVDWGGWALVRPGRRIAPPPPEPAPWRPIEATAADGSTLRGAFVAHPEAGGRTALVLHGFAEDRTALIGRGEMLARRGWNVALLDARDRGRSGGDFTSFGGREAGDLAAWLDALSDRVGPGFAPVAWGRSMGAAIALRAAAEDDRLRALVLEAPYADLRPTVAAWLAAYRLPGAFAGPILRRAHWLAGVSLDRPRPIDLAPRVSVPVLIVHGAADRVVPMADARRLADAFPTPAEVVDVPEGLHTDVFDVGGAALAERIAAFLDRAVPRG